VTERQICGLADFGEIGCGGVWLVALCVQFVTAVAAH
jgi:hypothetical protein